MTMTGISHIEQWVKGRQLQIFKADRYIQIWKNNG